MKWLIYLLCIDAGLGLIIPGLHIYGNFSIFDLIIVPLVLLIYIKKKKININHIGFKVGLIYILLAFWQLITVLISQENMVSGLGPVLRTFYYGLLILLLLPEINTKERIDGISISIVIGITINMIYTLYLWSLNERYLSGIIFLNNDFVNRNTVYYYALFVLPFLFYLINRTNKKVLKTLLTVLLIFHSSMIMLTFSKGAWLLMLIVYLLYSLHIFFKINVSKIILMILFLTLSLIVVNEYKLFDAFKNLQLNNYSVEEDARLTYKLFAFETGANNLLFGIGMHNYRDHTLNYAPHEPTRDPHDVALMIFAENGIVGLALYLYLQYLFIITLVNLKKTERVVNRQNYYSKLSINIYIIAIILSTLTGVIFTSKLSLVMIFIIFGIVNVLKSKKIKR